MISLIRRCVNGDKTRGVFVTIIISARLAAEIVSRNFLQEKDSRWDTYCENP